MHGRATPLHDPSFVAHPISYLLLSNRTYKTICHIEHLTMGGDMFRKLWAVSILAIIVIMTMVASNQSSAAQTPDQGLSINKSGRHNPGDPAQSSAPDTPVGFALDDGWSENALGFGSSSSNRSASAIWLNRFTVPADIPYPLTFTNIQIMFPITGDFVGDPIRLLIYRDADNDGNPANATLIFQETRIIETADWVTFQDFPISGSVQSRGDLYVGWEDQWAEGGPSPLEYVAAIDETQSQHRSWLIARTECCSPSISNLGSNDYRKTLDQAGYPGNLMIRLIVDSYTPPTATPTSTPTPIPPRCPGETFTDVCPGDYFYIPVNALNQAGIVSGYTTSPPCETPAHVPCFRPASNVTRGQTSKIISLAAGFNDPVSGQIFEDVPVGSTFYTYIGRLADRNIINGYACGAPGEPCVSPGNLPYFRPNANLTRGQLAKIASESFGYSDTINMQTFEDVPQGSTFHVYIERLVMRDIINGYPCGGAGEPCVPPGNRPYFRPSNQVTRAQTAKIVYLAMTQPTPTPTVTTTSTATTTSTSTVTSTPTITSTPAERTFTPTPTTTLQTTTTPSTTTTTTSTSIITMTSTSTPTSTETPAACCTDVTGTITAACAPNPYTVTYSTTNNCPIQKTANIALMFEVSPNSNGPWSTLMVGDCWECPIPTGTTNHTMTVYSGALPAGNNYWRYRLEFVGTDCSWYLSLASNAQPGCIAPTPSPSPFR